MDPCVDSKLLIREIERYPCLYDISCDDYADRELKRHAWKAVAEKVAEASWDQMDEMARSNVVKEAQNKWKNLKDAFMRSLRIEAKRSSGARKRKRPYIYRKEMAFLLAADSQSKTLEHMNNYKGMVNDEASEAPAGRACEPVVCASLIPKKKANPLTKEVFRNTNANEDAANTEASEAVRAFGQAIIASPWMTNNRIIGPFEMDCFRNMYASGSVGIEANEAQIAKANGPSIVASPWMPTNGIAGPFGREVFQNMIANKGLVINQAARACEPAIVALSRTPNEIMTNSFEKSGFRNTNASEGVVNIEAPVVKTYEPNIVASSAMTEERRRDPFKKEIPPKVLQTDLGQQDVDEMFLLSQLPSIKKIKTNNKLQFQIKFLQLVHTYSNMDESPAVQNPPPANNAFASISETSSVAELNEDEKPVVI